MLDSDHASMVKLVTVFNLSTGDEQVFTCSHREAVIAAYAQFRGDFNTWDYETKYGKMVRYSGINDRTVSCGDFAAFRQESHEPAR